MGLITYKSALAVSDNITGWLTPKERDGLLQAAILAWKHDCKYIELGSFQGKSTVVIASVLKIKGSGQLYAIDPHEGRLSYPEAYKNGRLIGKAEMSQPSTLHTMIDNLYLADVREQVNIHNVESTKFNVEIMGLFDFLFIDALHDEENVQADWNYYCDHLAEGAIVAWHDYDAWDGVNSVVDRLIRYGIITKLYQYDSLIVTKTNFKGQ